jgi:hypothetical protein
MDFTHRLSTLSDSLVCDECYPTSKAGKGDQIEMVPNLHLDRSCWSDFYKIWAFACIVVAVLAILASVVFFYLALSSWRCFSR